MIQKNRHNDSVHAEPIIRKSVNAIPISHNSIFVRLVIVKLYSAIYFATPQETICDVVVFVGRLDGFRL